MDFIELAGKFIFGLSPVVTAIAASVAALAAWAGYRHIIDHEKPILDFRITKSDYANNVLRVRLTVRNASRTTIVVKNIRLLKPKFPRSGNPKIGLASEKSLDQTAKPLAELREPFKVEPEKDGNKDFFFFLYESDCSMLPVKLGVDIEYIGTTIKTERATATSRTNR